MQKWSSKHIKKKKTKNTQGEKAPSQGKLAGPTEPHQAGYSVSPPSPQGGESPAPPPAHPSPEPAPLSRGDASTEPPLPPAIIRGASAPPRCRGQLSTPLYIILLYRRAVLPSYGSRKHGQDTIRGGPCLPPTPIPLSPSSWTPDPHGRGAHSGPGTWKSVAPARSVRRPRDLPLCGLHPESCTCTQGE